MAQLSDGVIDIQVGSITQYPGSDTYLIPGGALRGTVTIRPKPKKPLSLSRIDIWLEGASHCYIYKVFIFSNWSVNWFSNDPLFQRRIVLMSENVVLNPGQEYTFNFAFRIPTFTDVAVDGKISADQPPWYGRTSAPHPLPPSMDLSNSGVFGHNTGTIQYKLQVVCKKGPDAGFWANAPFDIKFLQLTVPRTIAIPTTDTSRQSQTHNASSGPITVNLLSQQDMVQGMILPISMNVEGLPPGAAAVLKNIEVHMGLTLQARAHNGLLGTKRATIEPMWSLIQIKDGNIPLSQGYTHLGSEYRVPANIPTAFTSYNGAVVGHSISVTYTIVVNGAQKIRGNFTKVPFRLLNWIAPRQVSSAEIAAEDQAIQRWCNLQVMNGPQYREYKMALKKGRKS